MTPSDDASLNAALDQIRQSVGSALQLGMGSEETLELPAVQLEPGRPGMGHGTSKDVFPSFFDVFLGEDPLSPASAPGGSQAGRRRNIAFNGARLCRLRSNDVLFNPVGKKAIEPLLQRRVVADKAGFLLVTRLRAWP